jgi:glycosyltransferase involved in cell wall biosynthesis
VKPRPTVIHLADYGGPYSGSFIPMLRAAAAAIRGAGWDFGCAFTPVAAGRPWLGELERDGIEPWFAPDVGRAELAEWIVERAAEVEGPLILHTHFTRFDLPAATVGRRRDRTTAVWHFHSYLPRDPRGVLRAALKVGWIGRRAEIICVSEATAAAVRRRGAARRRVHLIENAIDSARFPRANADERERARARLGLPEGSSVFLHFGWDWQVKGGPLFSEMLARLVRSGTEAIGISVGGGEAARSSGARLGLGESLRPLEPTEDVRSLYAAADALVACSAAEGAPFAMLESLCCGLAVIATDIAGHRLAPELPAALRLVPLDPDGLAAAATAVISRSDDDREAESEQAHRWIEAERDLSGWTERLMALYERSL